LLVEGGVEGRTLIGRLGGRLRKGRCSRRSTRPALQGFLSALD
jgi:hypothetical protein